MEQRRCPMEDQQMQIYDNSVLKWTKPQTHPKIAVIMDQAIKEGCPEDWFMNWIKSIHKGDKNLVSNYRTITVNFVMSKLYGTIVEQKISSWSENNHK